MGYYQSSGQRDVSDGRLKIYDSFREAYQAPPASENEGAAA
jgi:hypothetical protein